MSKSDRIRLVGKDSKGTYTGQWVDYINLRILEELAITNAKINGGGFFWIEWECDVADLTAFDEWKAGLTD